MVLWANLHSFWFVGLLMLLCTLIGERKNRRQLLLLTLCCSLAVLVNPYGLELVKYNFSFVSQPEAATQLILQAVETIAAGE